LLDNNVIRQMFTKYRTHETYRLLMLAVNTAHNS